MSRIDAELLVLGSGLAGSMAALSAASMGRSVILIGSEGSASQLAQGGIAYRGSKDPEQFIADIIKAGCECNYLPTVELIVRKGPKYIEAWLLDKLNISFDRLDDGTLDLALEAAHNTPRILHIKDSTGATIMDRVDEAIRKQKNIQRCSGVLVDLMMSHLHDKRREKSYETGRATGAYIFDRESEEVVTITARAVILATGGFSKLFEHSTAPGCSRGDGISAAHRAGARTLDLEYVQFHPTALYIPSKPRSLLTEALRGAGAKLLNADKKHFVDELASRDVVAREIHEELLRSRSPNVWLDLRPIDKFDERFPAMLELLKAEELDPCEDLIPVVPAAHYTIGGVWTDLDGATNLPGLFAAGEVACTGLHGANRLASTSLLETLVFGVRSAQAASAYIDAQGDFDFMPREWNAEHDSVDAALLFQDWQLLRQTLWNYLGLVRSQQRLKRAERILVELRTEVETFYKRGRLSEDLIGLRHGVLVGTLLLYAALRNSRSIGAHFLKPD